MQTESNLLDRRWVVKTLLSDRRDLLVVTGLGAPTYDCAAAGDHPGNFYLWGAMGGGAMVGLGLALAQPDRRVVVITGDGEQLMGLGALATIGAQGPDNLAIVVLDNERYGETGMQRTHTAHGVDLAGIARASGFPDARTVRGEDEVHALAAALRQGRGLLLADVKVSPEDLPRVLPSRDGAYIKTRFREHVLGQASA